MNESCPGCDRALEHLLAARERLRSLEEEVSYALRGYELQHRGDKPARFVHRLNARTPPIVVASL